MNQIFFLNTPINDISQDIAINMISQWALEDKYRYIVTPNVDHALRIYKDPKDLAAMYEMASLSLCDSKILYFLSKLQRNNRIRHVTTGSDLTKTIFSSGILVDETVTIIGGSDQVIKKTEAKFPIGRIFHYNPPMGFIKSKDEVNKCMKFILDNPSTYIFFAVGSPQQEKLAYALSHSSNAKGVALCIGASLLFLIGDEKRSPAFISKVGLEWFYRLSQDPRRLAPRYFKNIELLFAWAKNRLLNRN